MPALVFAGDGETTTLTAKTDRKPFAVVSGRSNLAQPFRGCVNIYGTFASATVHWMVSTDDGTTFTALKNKSGTAVTSTAADNFCFDWMFSPVSASDQTIFYASVAGASNPTLTIDLFTNR